MDDLLLGSREIVQSAIANHKPYAIIAAISGGDDSLTAYAVALALNVKPDFILHVDTRTGIRETSEFVRKFALIESSQYSWPIQYLYADAGSSYEDYVLNNGFFGRGHVGHNYTYHLLKATHFRRQISHNIRHGKHNRKVLIISGVRTAESDNRKKSKPTPISTDPASKSNIWVDIIHHWQKSDCLDFLNDQGFIRNPVTCNLGRSGECMCGTMQSAESRWETAGLYPAWGRWLNELENRVHERGHWWNWGDDIPDAITKMRQGQLPIPGFFQPMCASCKG